jgi:hypothetical protein
MLEPRMVAARIQGPLVRAGRSHEPARIAASSQGGLEMLAIVHSPLGADSMMCLVLLIRIVTPPRRNTPKPRVRDRPTKLAEHSLIEHNVASVGDVEVEGANDSSGIASRMAAGSSITVGSRRIRKRFLGVGDGHRDSALDP